MDTTTPSAEKVRKGGRKEGREGGREGKVSLIYLYSFTDAALLPSLPPFLSQVEFFTLKAAEKDGGKIIHTTLSTEETTVLLNEVAATTAPEGDM